MMSLMTAGFGQMLSSYTSPLIDRFLPEIQSPILDNVLRNGLDNSISGFALGTLFSFNEEGQTLGGALQEGLVEGGKGLVLGAISGIGTGIKEARTNNLNPWTGNHNALTNEALVNKAADKANIAIDEMGHVGGTKKHGYAEDLIDRYQSIYGDRGLPTEYRFDKGIGNSGRLDVYDIKHKVIYNFKFGPKARMPKAQYNKYHNNFKNHNIIIIKR